MGVPTTPARPHPRAAHGSTRIVRPWTHARSPGSLGDVDDDDDDDDDDDERDVIIDEDDEDDDDDIDVEVEKAPLDKSVSPLAALLHMTNKTFDGRTEGNNVNGMYPEDVTAGRRGSWRVDGGHGG